MGLYTYGLILNSKSILFVFSYLLMVLVIITVILVLWVLLYSTTVYDGWTSITVNTLFMAYISVILDPNAEKWDGRQDSSHSLQDRNSLSIFSQWRPWDLTAFHLITFLLLGKFCLNSDPMITILPHLQWSQDINTETS